MKPTWEPFREPDAQRVWEALLRPLAIELRSCAEEFAEQAVARVQDEMPGLFPDPQSVEENVVSTAASLRNVADLLDIGGDPRDAELSAPTRAVARAGVKRQVPLASLLRFYRVTHELLWQWMWDRITASAVDQSQQAATLRLATSWTFGYVDAAQNRAEEAYEAEREVWLRNAAAARTGAIEEILAQRERDPQRASKRLRYDVNRHHVGAVAWLEAMGDDGDAQSVLSEALNVVSRAIGGETTLIHPAGSLVAFGWFSGRNAFGTTDLDVPVPTFAAGVRVGIGEPGYGLKALRCSHLEASNARRVAALLGANAGTLTRYRDVAVAALASCNGELAEGFVHRVLGPLAADDEATSRVASTLSVYLQENRSRARTARRLIVHPNTVSYRVDQAQMILGRSIDTDSLDLAVALALLPTLSGLAGEL